MATILEAQTFDWQKAAQGQQAEGIAIIDITDIDQNLDTLAAHIDNAYSYQTYDIDDNDIPTSVSLFLTQDKTYIGASYPAPIDNALKTNKSTTTYLANETEELVPAADFRKELQSQAQLAVLDSQKKIILGAIEQLDQNKTEWVFNPAGSLLYCPVAANDRISAQGVQIWPRPKDVTPNNQNKKQFKP